MIVHLNGQLMDAREARISPFDRGFIFGDGIYEGLRSVRVPGRAPHVVGHARHTARMRAGLAALKIDFDPRVLERATVELLAANGLEDAFIYWEVTRGTPVEGEPVRERVPGRRTRPTVFGYCVPKPPLEEFERGGPPRKRVVTLEDIRWSLGHTKSVSMAGNVVLAMAAEAAGVEEAILVREGIVAEGLATNVLVVLRDGRVVTPSLASAPMLAGVTRAILLEESPEIEEVAVRAERLEDAREILLLGTTTMVTSVIELDGRPVGDGSVGPVARRLLERLVGAIRREAGM